MRGFGVTCDHNFKFLRQEVVEKNPGQWHSDLIENDVFFCEKCLEYKHVKRKEIPR